ncbi:OmpH family outer membrane protein, partial [Thermodesulfobacteriota bacterium]
KKYMADFKEQEKELVNRIQKELLKIVAKMGKKEGFLLILEKREAGIIYSPDTIDISDRVIQEYNAVFAQKTVKKDKTNKKQ